MKQRILIIGDGFIGSNLYRCYKETYDVEMTNKEILDVCSLDNIRAYFRENSEFTHIIYAAGLKDVKYCELNPRRCYLEREFLEKYVRICKMIAKTALYVDRFYQRSQHNVEPWGTVEPWRTNAITFRMNLDRVIKKLIPKTQMSQNAKNILLQVIRSMPRLSGGMVETFRNNITEFVNALLVNPDLMEEMIRRWREGMATETNMRPKQIEEMIRRFIRNL